MAATFRSLWLGTGVAAIAVLLGVPAAIAIDRMTPSWQKAALGVAVLPILLPPVVIAVAMYMTFTRLGLVGTPAGLVAGHLMLALPFVVLTSVAALRKLDPELTRAARSLGAGRTRILFTVTLPLIRPSILSGALLAFLTSFDELVIALFLGSPQLRTLPRRMWEGIRSEFDPTVAAASAMVVVATLLAALALQLLAHAARRRIRPS
nr:ABC transporter permease [Afifella sp. IM 167]